MSSQQFIGVIKEEAICCEARRAESSHQATSQRTHLPAPAKPNTASFANATITILMNATIRVRSDAAFARNLATTIKIAGIDRKRGREVEMKNKIKEATNRKKPKRRTLQMKKKKT